MSIPRKIQNRRITFVKLCPNTYRCFLNLSTKNFTRHYTGEGPTKEAVYEAMLHDRKSIKSWLTKNHQRNILAHAA